MLVFFEFQLTSSPRCLQSASNYVSEDKSGHYQDCLKYHLVVFYFWPSEDSRPWFERACFTSSLCSAPSAVRSSWNSCRKAKNRKTFDRLVCFSKSFMIVVMTMLESDRFSLKISFGNIESHGVIHDRPEFSDKFSNNKSLNLRNFATNFFMKIVQKFTFKLNQNEANEVVSETKAELILEDDLASEFPRRVSNEPKKNWKLRVLCR